MKIRFVSLLTAILSLYTVHYAQSISIDLDTNSGIQNSFITNDTSATVAVAIRLRGVNLISSYQFKVSFDTTKFTFIAAQQDFGITGEKNILTKNSGSIIGIAQSQLNPPAKDTIEFSYTMTGNNVSTLVSGDGLAGVLYLKSKLSIGDSSAIAVSNCILADFDLNQTTVSVYNKGTYSVLPVTRSIDTKTSSGKTSPLILSVSNCFVKFDVPESELSSSKLFTIAFYTLSGKYLAGYNLIKGKNGFYTLSGNNNTMLNQAGRYLCCLKTDSRKYSQIVTVSR